MTVADRYIPENLHNKHKKLLSSISQKSCIPFISLEGVISIIGILVTLFLGLMPDSQLAELIEQNNFYIAIEEKQLNIAEKKNELLQEQNKLIEKSNEDKELILKAIYFLIDEIYISGDQTENIDNPTAIDCQDNNQDNLD